MSDRTSSESKKLAEVVQITARPTKFFVDMSKEHIAKIIEFCALEKLRVLASDAERADLDRLDVEIQQVRDCFSHGTEVSITEVDNERHRFIEYKIYYDDHVFSDEELTKIKHGLFDFDDGNHRYKHYLHVTATVDLENMQIFSPKANLKKMKL